MEGLILSTEVSNKRVKLISKYLKIGKIETMTVIRIDKEKRYIDLSKKKVQPAEAQEADKHFKKAKMVHNILKQVATKLDCTLLSLYETFGWDLYDKYGHAFDAFRMIMNDPDQVFKEITIEEEQKKALVEAISRKMAPTPVKLRADFEITCFTYEGVDALREALLTAKKAVNEETFKVDFKMIAPPHYKCECITLDKVKGHSKLEEALSIIEKVIKEKKGTYKLVNKPQIIGAKDDKDIEDIMAKLNEEKGSDESGSEDNEEGIEIDLEEDEEEEKKSSKKGGKKKRKDSDDEDDDDDDN